MSKYTIYGIENIEQAALEQFYSALEQPCVIQAALMPDAHAGYALPIGAVVATKDMIFPSWVGYDIGCGMCAIRSSFSKKDIEENKKKIFDQIYRDVPTGFSHNQKPEDWSYTFNVSSFVQEELINKQAPNKQIGTLGGGNHFIEIGYDEDDIVWIIIHSGSRNVGHKIATHYMKIASGDGKAREGHYGLDADSEEGRNYIDDLDFGLMFALDNRRTMLDRIEKAIQHVGLKGSLEWNSLINRNHNHAEYKDGLWIHRKGATHAEKGMLGVIPGNMRDGSFIVEGKGNPDSLCSSSHGAGRVLSRKAAKEQLKLEDFTSTMQSNSIQAKVDSSTLDESPFAYKNIFDVMNMQKDLVHVLRHIKPMINIKGAGKEC